MKAVTFMRVLEKNIMPSGWCSQDLVVRDLQVQCKNKAKQNQQIDSLSTNLFNKANIIRLIISVCAICTI